MDLELLRAADVRNIVGEQPGRIDDVTRLDRPSVRGGQRPVVVSVFAGDGFEIAEELHAVPLRGFDQAEHIAVRFDRTAVRRVKAADDLGIQLRFELEQAVAAAHFEIPHAVVESLQIELADGRHLLLRKGDDENSVAVERKIQLVLKLVEHQVAENFEFRLQRLLRRVVETAVDDPRIRLRDAEADVGPPFDQRDLQVVARQLPRGRRAGDSGADNDCIIHVPRSF